MNANKRKMLEDAGIIYPSVVTNADRIRAMSDEELLEYLYGICDCDHADVPCKEHCGEMPCRDAWMKWLKQKCNE